MERPDALYFTACEDLDLLDHSIGPFDSAKTVARKALLKALIKKIEPEEGITPEQKLLAKAKFLACNDVCKGYKWDSTKFPLIGNVGDIIVGELKRKLYRFFEPIIAEIHWGRLFDLGNLGPGVTFSSEGATSFPLKMWNKPLTATRSKIYTHYAIDCEKHHLWQDAEKSRRELYGECEVVQGSRLAYAKKTREIARTITIQATLNMFYQRGFGKMIDRQLDRVYNIDLAIQQTVNRELARLGSISGLLATLDLESASDLISLSFCRRVLPKEIMEWIEVLRSPQFFDPDEKVWVDLHMVSEMGNGFTFSLMTAIMAVIVDVAYDMLNLPLEKGIRHNRLRHSSGETANFAVFGDDIICLTRAYDMVCKILDACGLKVNQLKSFSTGTFRESCGADYVSGTNVRGVYAKDLSSQQSLCSLINRLNRWCARHDVIMPRTVSLLKRWAGKVPLVPAIESDDAGIHVPLSFFFATPKRRSENQKHGRCFAYRRFEVKPSKVDYGERSWSSTMLGYLRGDIAGGFLTIRDWRVRYRSGTGFVPDWDLRRKDLPAIGWRTWERCAILNLS